MASTIQIFGTKKCSDTNKAIRFFKERGIKTQFIDLTEKAISRGELSSICRSFALEDLIDTDGKEFRAKNMKYMTYNLEDELLANPLLFRTPITRFAHLSAIGHTPEIWKLWIAKL